MALGPSPAPSSPPTLTDTTKFLFSDLFYPSVDRLDAASRSSFMTTESLYRIQ